jgi:elongation factor P--beta-lysine ligase
MLRVLERGVVEGGMTKAGVHVGSNMNGWVAKMKIVGDKKSVMQRYEVLMCRKDIMNKLEDVIEAEVVRENLKRDNKEVENKRLSNSVKMYFLKRTNAPL